MSTFTVNPKDLSSLRNKVVLITGGSSGIGLATAKLITSLDPSNKISIVDLAPPPKSAFANTEQLLFQKCDITRWTELRAAFTNTVHKFGRIDAVFVNAGIAEYGDQFFQDDLDVEGQLKEPDRRVLKIDLDAAADTLKLAIHHLRRNRDGGSIVLTASLAGYLASAGAGLYSAAKHGVVGLMRALKHDTKQFGIAISVIAPGITITPILAANREDEMKGDKGRDEAINDWAKDMRKAGVPINSAESIALAVGYLFNGGLEKNGAGILIQEDRMWDFEAAMAKSREVLMGKEMLDLFRGGRTAPLFKRVEDKSKI